MDEHEIEINVDSQNISVLGWTDNIWTTSANIKSDDESGLCYVLLLPYLS